MSPATCRFLAAGCALLPLLAQAAPPLPLPAPAASAPVTLAPALRALPALPALKNSPAVTPAVPPALLPPTAAATNTAALRPAGDPASPAAVYVSIQALRQGRLKGEVSSKGLENTSQVTLLSHGLAAPTNPASGLRSGPIRNQPLVFRHPMGAMAVQLQEAQVGNERLIEVLFQTFAPDATGRELPVLSLRLLNALVIDVKELSGEAPNAPRSQEVSLSYQRLEVTDLGSGLVAVDDRASPSR
jgi:type VI secretion system Hcp family effector